MWIKLKKARNYSLKTISRLTPLINSTTRSSKSSKRTLIKRCNHFRDSKRKLSTKWKNSFSRNSAEMSLSFRWKFKGKEKNFRMSQSSIIKLKSRWNKIIMIRINKSSMSIKSKWDGKLNSIGLIKKMLKKSIVPLY